MNYPRAGIIHYHVERSSNIIHKIYNYENYYKSLNVVLEFCVINKRFMHLQQKLRYKTLLRILNQNISHNDVSTNCHVG